MPDLEIFLVDWDEAKKRHKQGVLRAALHDEITAKNKWIKDLCWFKKAPADYFDIAEAWECMSGDPEDVPAKMHESALEFMNVLITYQDYHNDLNENGEDFLLAISPKAAAHFSKLAAQVDFSRYEQTFETYCPPDVQESVASYLPEKQQDKPFKKAFLPFVQLWVKMLSDAATQQKGLLAVVQ